MRLLPVLGLFVAATAAPSLSFSVDSSGGYDLVVDGTLRVTSPASAAPDLCVDGAYRQLTLTSSTPTSGSDGFGAWSGPTLEWRTAAPAPVVRTTWTFKQYASRPGLAVVTETFPDGVPSTGCSSAPSNVSSRFPAFATSSALAPSLSVLSWANNAVQDTLTVTGLGSLPRGQLDDGPVVAFTLPLGATAASVVWSTLDAHKIVTQVHVNGTGAADAYYAMGVSAAIPSIPAGWNHSVIFFGSYGGPTAAVYEWGAALQQYHGTTRIPSVTLTDIGYYTDDGAYYYVWEAFNISARPWPAEQGLLLVKEALWAAGVPVAYMQLDDWWYTGPFYFGNVKAVVNWTASAAPRLFPHGLPAFSDLLGLSLQLYTPFWDVDYDTTFAMTPSTVFPGTKLPTPNASYGFFSSVFDDGALQTNGRFKTYEIDFLDSNFAGSAAMFTDVDAADRWYEGMAAAALERGIAIQYCLPSATDILQALAYPAVVQARASSDYVSKVLNAQQVGGSSLLLGALAIAPSKDTLWTASPQPGTMSDTEHNGMSYTTQPHVVLDAILATLSLGPVGLSDCLGCTDAGLITQAFRCANDSTLLRPSRPLSWVDSYLVNGTLAGVEQHDVRSTHAALPTSRDPSSSTFNTHYVVAWATTGPVTLGPTDLFPAPPAGATLAVRQHIVASTNASVGPAQQYAGCVAGSPAAPACVTLVNSSAAGVVIAATGGNASNVSLTAVHEPLPNGAFFLGELTKFVHTSPQRFDFVAVDNVNGGAAGLVVGVRGAPGEAITLVAVDATGIVRTAVAAVPESGFVDVRL